MDCLCKYYISLDIPLLKPKGVPRSQDLQLVFLCQLLENIDAANNPSLEIRLHAALLHARAAAARALRGLRSLHAARPLRAAARAAPVRRAPRRAAALATYLSLE